MTVIIQALQCKPLVQYASVVSMYMMLARAHLHASTLLVVGQWISLSATHSCIFVYTTPQVNILQQQLHYFVCVLAQSPFVPLNMRRAHGIQLCAVILMSTWFTPSQLHIDKLTLFDRFDASMLAPAPHFTFRACSYAQSRCQKLLYKQTVYPYGLNHNVKNSGNVSKKGIENIVVW